jgi:hypothetical protein
MGDTDCEDGCLLDPSRLGGGWVAELIGSRAPDRKPNCERRPGPGVLDSPRPSAVAAPAGLSASMPWGSDRDAAARPRGRPEESGRGVRAGVGVAPALSRGARGAAPNGPKTTAPTPLSASASARNPPIRLRQDADPREPSPASPMPASSVSPVLLTVHVTVLRRSTRRGRFTTSGVACQGQFSRPRLRVQRGLSQGGSSDDPALEHGRAGLRSRSTARASHCHREARASSLKL